MLFQAYFVASLLFITSAAALLSTTSTSHPASTTKKTVLSTVSTRHSTKGTTQATSPTPHRTSTTKKSSLSTSSLPHTTSTTKKTTVSTSSTRLTSSSSSTSSAATPTSTPSTFYLVTADTGVTADNGIYLHTALDPFVPAYTRMTFNTADKTPQGASNFTLLANGTLQYNGDSGPQFACVADGHPQQQPVTLEYPALVDSHGLDQLTCKIAGGDLTCFSEQTGASVFYLDTANENVSIYSDDDGHPVTLKVVPT